MTLEQLFGNAEKGNWMGTSIRQLTDALELIEKRQAFLKTLFQTDEITRELSSLVSLQETVTSVLDAFQKPIKDWKPANSHVQDA